MKVFLTGGAGLLGKHLIANMTSRGIEYIAPTHTDYDIMSYQDIVDVAGIVPDVVIHSAAIAKFKVVETDVPLAIKTNVIGTCNVLLSCMKHNIRMVYISTDHIFDGQDGKYKTTDRINPLSKYAKSKAAGDIAVRMYENSLVIRTSFCDTTFAFDTAYIDKWSSQDYVDIVAPKILDKALSEETGICNIGHTRRSFYDLAKERSPNIKIGSVQDILKTSTVPILIDTSLDV